MSNIPEMLSLVSESSCMPKIIPHESPNSSKKNPPAKFPVPRNGGISLYLLMLFGSPCIK